MSPNPATFSRHIGVTAQRIDAGMLSLNCSVESGRMKHFLLPSLFKFALSLSAEGRSTEVSYLVKTEIDLIDVVVQALDSMDLQTIGDISQRILRRVI